MASTRNFLFLQGPHGPFFAQLGHRLRETGAQVWRIGFNAGDAAFWGRSPGYIPFQGTLNDWPDVLAQMLTAHEITDIALYGDTRPIHTEAVRQAKAAGIRMHIFEEGYLRPYWITYERDGSNGHSRLMNIDLAQMQAAPGTDIPVPPAQWGDMRQHIFYGALYHWFVL
ncbi:MAG: capsule biosynthesis protein CapA, partial [Pseudomonadota bacterium]